MAASAKTAPAYWLLKSEPHKYSWAQFVRDRQTYWDGVRNYTARNNLRAMRRGDLALFYHSNVGKEVVGVARVIRTAYPDPTAADDPRWLVVDLQPVAPLAQPVTLAQLKADAAFAEMELLRQPRLSVSKVTARHFARVLKLGETKI